jgi:hypothetical protein
MSLNNYRPAALAVALAAALALSASVFATTADHSHGGHVAAPAKLALDHGKKWATDAPLREGMNTIRAFVAAKLDAIHRSTFTPDEYKALGAAIERQVGNIVAQCKLPADADAMLHLVVADLLAGVDALQGKANGNVVDGAHQVVVAANNYGRYFNHPGWKPLR